MGLYDFDSSVEQWRETFLNKLAVYRSFGHETCPGVVNNDVLFVMSIREPTVNELAHFRFRDNSYLPYFHANKPENLVVVAAVTLHGKVVELLLPKASMGTKLVKHKP